jgi:sarcosine oxidase subunit beta
VPIPGVSTKPLRSGYDAVIAGGGIQGIALAYELAKRGMRDVAVLEASWPGSGASGRNGEMIRSAFASEEWCRLFDHSLRKWHGLSAELDFNTLFTPAGYAVLAATEAEAQGLRSQLPRHRELGLHTRWLDGDEARELMPAVSPELMTGALWQEDGGFAHHDAVLWGYARAAARAGVEIHAFTPVEDVTVRGGRVEGVTVAGGRQIATPLVVDAAGGFAREVAAMAGVDLPTQRMLLEILVTESVQPFVRPAVASLALLGYCHQTSRGEFVGGTEFKAHNPADRSVVTLEGLRDMASKWVRLFPALAGVRVVRHWSGVVDHTPDLAPVLGPVPEVEGLVLDCGWMYGFVGAPGTADLLARWIVDGEPDPILEPFGVQRLHDGRLIHEGATVVPTGETA